MSLWWNSQPYKCSRTSFSKTLISALSIGLFLFIFPALACFLLCLVDFVSFFKYQIPDAVRKNCTVSGIWYLKLKNCRGSGWCHSPLERILAGSWHTEDYLNTIKGWFHLRELLQSLWGLISIDSKWSLQIS